MRAGTLKHSIVIQTYATTKNDYGEQTRAWSTFATRYAQKIENQGNEIVQSGKPVQTQTRTFKFRYVDNMTPDMRIQYHSLYWGITAIQSDPQDTRYQIVTIEQQSETVTP
jgi:SPP1 family predicted phage head-tail adaptor